MNKVILMDCIETKWFHLNSFLLQDSPLSSKVAMFNQQVDQHKQSQLLNPFSQTDGRASPKPSFSKDEYGK